MLHSIFSRSSLAVVALATSVACGSARAPVEPSGVAADPVTRADAPAGAALPPAPSASAAVQSGPSLDESAADSIRSTRPNPMQTLEQLLTAQALLVSLLLTPLSRDGGEQIVARVDAPAVIDSPVR